MRKIILASGSPRRKELLNQIGIEFEVIKSDCEEIVTEQEPEKIVLELSGQKASDVAGKVPEGVILGADTIVCLDGKVMGKPKDEEEACRMLRSLSGRTHEVFTGVTILSKDKNKEISKLAGFFSKTLVHVTELSEEEIRNYVATKDPLDKAGAYGIQGPFAAFIDSIEGDYNNVVGLPVAAVYRELKRIGESAAVHNFTTK